MESNEGEVVRRIERKEGGSGGRSSEREEGERQ